LACTGERIIAPGPNIHYLPGAYWDFCDHHLALTELFLGEAMAETGFTLDEKIPRFPPTRCPGHAASDLDGASVFEVEVGLAALR